MDSYHFEKQTTQLDQQLVELMAKIGDLNPNMQELVMENPFIIQAITAWVIQKMHKVQCSGLRLPKKYYPIAKFLRVKNYERIKFMIDTHGDIIDKPEIRCLLRLFHIDMEKIGAVTFGNTIILHPQFYENDLVMAHELRHVSQIEACGSLHNYWTYYLLEMAHFGYGKGPLEIDAMTAAHAYMRELQKEKIGIFQYHHAGNLARNELE